jgi:guanine nucleotide-binding protein alpha-1 subunit
MPTDNDVVRARLRTVGVQEHRFVFEQGMSLLFFPFSLTHYQIRGLTGITTRFDPGRASGTEWILYDVGGHRSSVSFLGVFSRGRL